MGYRATLIAVFMFAAVACGSSKNSDAQPDASLIGTGGGGVDTGSGGAVGSGSGGSSPTGTGTGSGTGGSAAAGTGGNGSNPGMMSGGTGGRGGFNRDGGMPMMFMCPATQPMDGATCMGGGRGGFGGRGMSCMFGDMTCRCRRGMWSCNTMMPPDDQDAGM
jgi:hypothetical protein